MLTAGSLGTERLNAQILFGYFDDELFTDFRIDGYGGKRIKMQVETAELYNMMRDPGEQYNVIEYYPEKVEELMQVVEAARAELGDLNVGIEKGIGTREIGRKQ